MNIQIRNGRLIDPKNKIDAIQDVFISAGKIVATGKAPAGFKAEKIIDANDPLNKKKRELDLLKIQNEINAQRKILETPSPSPTP